MQMILLGHDGGTNLTADTGHWRPVGLRSPQISPEISRTMPFSSNSRMRACVGFGAGVWPGCRRGEIEWLNSAEFHRLWRARSQAVFAARRQWMTAEREAAYRRPTIPRRKFHRRPCPLRALATACAGPEEIAKVKSGGIVERRQTFTHASMAERTSAAGRVRKRTTGTSISRTNSVQQAALRSNAYFSIAGMRLAATSAPSMATDQQGEPQ